MRAYHILPVFAFLVLTLAAPVLAACPPPQNFQNHTSVEDQGVLVSFATNRHTYAPGETIDFYLSFENTGSEAVSFPCPYSPEYRILIFPDTCLTPDQPGCDNYGVTYFVLPEGVYWFSPGIHLGPGACYAPAPTWSYVSSSVFPPPPGNYRVFGGLPGTGGEEFSVPTGGVELTFTVASTSGIPSEEPPVEKRPPTTWGAIKAFYR